MNPKYELKDLFSELLNSDEKFGRKCNKSGIEIIADIYQYANDCFIYYDKITSITRDNNIRQSIQDLKLDNIKKELDKFLFKDDINKNHIKEEVNFENFELDEIEYLEPDQINKFNKNNNYIINIGIGDDPKFIIKYKSFILMYDSKPGNGNQKFHVYYQNINGLVPIILFNRSLFANDFDLYQILPNIVADRINGILLSKITFYMPSIKTLTIEEVKELLKRKRIILEFTKIKNDMYKCGELEDAVLISYKNRLIEQIKKILDMKFHLEGN